MGKGGRYVLGSYLVDFQKKPGHTQSILLKYMLCRVKWFFILHYITVQIIKFVKVKGGVINFKVL